jgi:multimeric flavodoxin WrbA
MSVKLLGICGSYRRASTYAVLSTALEEAEKQQDVETTLYELRGQNIHGCIGCNRCLTEEVNRCLAFPSDDMKRVFDLFLEADAFLIATPVYSMGVTPVLSAFFSRFRPNFLLSRENPDMNLFRVGGAIAVGGTRNGGQETAISAIHGFYHTKGITVVNGGLGAYSGGSVWSRDGGAEGALADEVGMRHAVTMGRRVAKAALAMSAYQNS